MQKKPNNLVCQFFSIFFLKKTQYHAFSLLASQPDGDEEFESEEKDSDDWPGFRTSVSFFPSI